MKIKIISIALISFIDLISINSELIKNDSINIYNNYLLKDISKDVIFTTIVTISIFILGLLFKHIYDTYRESKRLNSIKKYFIKLIESLKKPLEVQCSSYDTLSSNIKDFQQYDFSYEENPRLNTEGFKQVSHYDFYKSIVGTSNRKNSESMSESFISTVNIIKSIELQKEFANINYQEFINRHREYISDFNINVNKLLRTFDRELLTTKDNDSFIKDMFNILKHSKTVNNNAKSIIDKIINPLYDFLLKRNEDKRSSTFLEITISIRKSYSDLCNLKKIYSKLFDNFSIKLNSMADELMNNLVIFNNKKMNN